MTLKARCSAFRVCERSSPSTVSSDLWGTSSWRSSTPSRGRLGAGGRHHPSDATTVSTPKLNFRSHTWHSPLLILEGHPATEDDVRVGRGLSGTDHELRPGDDALQFLVGH